MQIINENYQVQNINVSRLRARDWKSYRMIRLQALKSNPECYRSDFTFEANKSDEFWISMLESEKIAVFGLFDNKVLIGSARIAIDEKYPGEAILSASYIQKEYRGAGLSKLLFTARLFWAKEMKCSQVCVAHLDNNLPSKAAIKRAGFSHLSTEIIQNTQQEPIKVIKYLLKI